MNPNLKDHVDVLGLLSHHVTTRRSSPCVCVTCVHILSVVSVLVGSRNIRHVAAGRLQRHKDQRSEVRWVTRTEPGATHTHTVPDVMWPPPQKNVSFPGGRQSHSTTTSPLSFTRFLSPSLFSSLLHSPPLCFTLLLCPSLLSSVLLYPSLSSSSSSSPSFSSIPHFPLFHSAPLHSPPLSVLPHCHTCSLLLAHCRWWHHTCPVKCALPNQLIL